MIIAWYRMPEAEFKATINLDRLRRESASNSSAGSPGASFPSSPPQGAESLGGSGGGGSPARDPPPPPATLPPPAAASRARRPMLERPFAHALLDDRGFAELHKDHAIDTRLRERYS